MSTPALIFMAWTFVSPAKSHQGTEEMDVETSMGQGAGQTEPDSQYPPTYFALEEHSALIYGHIALMVIGWGIMLPVGKPLCKYTSCRNPNT